jgi:PGF-CTERM protein
MKIWKNSMILIGIAALLCATMTAAGVSDPTGDIYHQTWTGTSYSWEVYSGSKPNIDITDISYTINGNEITLTMTVAGSIENSQNIVYYMYLRASEDSAYMVSYVGGTGMFFGTGDFAGTMEILTTPPISADGKALEYTFTVADPNLDYEAWGYAAEYLNIGDTQGEAWLDYAPGTFAPWYTAGDGDGDSDGDGDGDGDGDTTSEDGKSSGGSPGFEILIALTAIGVALLVLSKRK